MRVNRKEVGLVLTAIIAFTSISLVYGDKGGTPFNELWETVFRVQGDVTSVEEQLDEALDLIAALEERVAEIESPGPGLAGLPEPDYDSDWRRLSQAITIDHNLGTTDLLIYVVGSTNSNKDNIHHIYYGSHRTGFHDPQGGAYWTSYSNHIEIVRGSSDTNWTYVRVYIWIIPTNIVDTDGDGLSDILENEVYGTDPTNPDTDGDGLDDYAEIFRYRSNPLIVDSDFDDLNDYDEVMVYGTHPNRWDTDDDTFSDGDEVLVYFTDPLDDSSHP